MKIRPISKLPFFTFSNEDDNVVQMKSSNSDEEGCWLHAIIPDESYPIKDCIQDTDFIVHACNNYEILVEALKYFVDRVDKGTIKSTKTYNMYKDLLKDLGEIE